jgi:Cu+-exporting ATPase
MAQEPVEVGPATRTEYICPMHPEVVRSEPGACPICGMSLEPRTVTVEEKNPELGRHAPAVLDLARAGRADPRCSW